MRKVSLPINTKPDIRAYMSEVAIFSILDFKDFAEDIWFSNPVFTANETTYNADNISMEQQGVEVVNKTYFSKKDIHREIIKKELECILAHEYKLYEYFVNLRV